MTLAAVVSPYQPINGLTGLGLNAGSLYIGVDGADPDTSPQACFWDAAGTIPASQPIQIMGGYPMRLGTPTRLYTGATYSIRVRDASGAQVFYEAHAVPPPPAQSVGFYASVAAAQAASVPSALQTVGINLQGYYSAGDGGGALYRFAAVQAAGLGKFQSADGAWWELAEALVTVKMFGAKGDGVADDTTALQNAVNYMSAKSVELVFPTGTYVVTSEIIVGGSYCCMRAEGLATLQKSGVNGYINAVTVADLSFPNAGAPGPMRGACFYFTTLIYYALIEGLTIKGFRFGCAYLTPHNSPTLRGVTFDSCNIGVFCYQGSQNYQLIDCSTQNGAGNLFVGSATCFPNGSPYAGQDNFFTDGLTVANEAGYGSLQCDVNANFDAWFQASILRPATGTYTATVSNYVYPFGGADACCNPSGRPVYAPFRAIRNCYFPTFRNVDLRGANYGGLALINTQIYGLRIDTIQHENAFQGFGGSPANAPWVTFGCIVNTVGGIVMNVSTETQGGSDVGHPFYRFTGQGNYTTLSEVIKHIATDIILPSGQQANVTIAKTQAIAGFGYNSSQVFDTGIKATPPGAGGPILALCSLGTNGANSVALYAIGRRTGTPTLDVYQIAGPSNLATFSVMVSGNIGVTAPGPGNYQISFLMSGSI